MRIGKVIALFASIAALTAQVAIAPAMAGGDASSQSPTAEQLRNAEWIKAGKKKFIRTCAYCHGKRGEGGKNRPFEERENWDAQEIFTVISEGRISGANAMPSWKDSFDPEQIWQIVAYIKSLSKDFPGAIEEK